MMDEYISITAELRLVETVCRHSGKDDIADLLQRAANAIEELKRQLADGVR